MPPKPVSTNPKTIATREWYARHKNDPGFVESRRKYLREHRNKIKHTAAFKAQKSKDDLKYRLKVRDSEEFRKKRNVFNAKYRDNPELWERSKQSVRRWADRNREKVRAHSAVRYAIRVGKLIRPVTCSKCSTIPTPRCDGKSGLHAHHKDYSKPLQVEWLCAFCHGNERRKW